VRFNIKNEVFCIINRRIWVILRFFLVIRDIFSCIIDNNLISNLRHNDDELDGPQKYTAISQFFKFPGEDDIRFRCKILLVPRDTVATSAVKIPKCAGIEINSTPSTKNSISFPDEIETFTLSEWISVEDSMEGEVYKLYI
jgi:hypothetical protein